MSATNRGSVRRPSDFYETPPEALEALLKARPFRGDETVLEPAAGSGSIAKILLKHYPGIFMICIENDERIFQALSSSNIPAMKLKTDYLQYDTDRGFDTIITNPPFSLAREFLEHTFENVAGEKTEVIFLLRLAFLESQERYQFWQKYPADAIYVLSRRPSFTGGGTDATAYAWFVWNSQRKERAINVI